MPPAVILAGGPPEPRLAPGLPNKAFLRLGGITLVERALEAARGCPAIDRVVVVGPVAALRDLLGDGVDVVAQGAGMMDNVTAGVRALPGATAVLAIAADLPLLTSEALGRFLSQCEGDYSLFYPIVPRQAVEQRFPGARKTYVRVADGVFTGGSVLLFDPSALERARGFVERMMAARKKPWLLAQLFGWSTVLKFASGALSIAEMEARARDVTGLRARAVIVDDPALALDVDAGRPENLALLRGALEGDRPGGA
ncbi:MAG: nucleotidyltransferase family protein [Armatimonadota bacterium]|nr:nucleotidyltransferase family protein [Armatimonadota bacterium]MDR7533213.1 nucleotidyltransferase family protein [Armatimonadota bacterium]MDR7535399.1 nucleotidyltransferase family protein [Armatimonadota bacterium]